MSCKRWRDGGVREESRETGEAERDKGTERRSFQSCWSEQRQSAVSFWWVKRAADLGMTSLTSMRNKLETNRKRSGRGSGVREWGISEETTGFDSEIRVRWEQDEIDGLDSVQRAATETRSTLWISICPSIYTSSICFTWCTSCRWSVAKYTKYMYSWVQVPQSCI